ncbi:MAG: glycoside hydrolase family 3 C-terminal domain-containing protein [Gammaproteobacteria bacterium]|nr:glycoside hydrolase family 3 C-terminal domain-containing protein [Gammaproteobacteria bacterium]
MEMQVIEAEIAHLVRHMTLRQKIGQMIQAEISTITPREAGKYHIGSILNGGGCYPNDNKHAHIRDWLALADAYYDATTRKTSETDIVVPIMWGTDAVHGHSNLFGATIFPHNIGLGAAGNPDLLEAIGAATAREVVASGLDWTFAPTLAVARDDRWGRSYESYSEDPEIVRDYASRMIIGLQGDAASHDFAGPQKVLATAKHFIGEGGTFEGIDQGNAICSEAELRDIHGQGHLNAIAAGAQIVMAAFNEWNGRKIHGHRYLLTDILKEKIGFSGFVISDWNGYGQLAESTIDACVYAINAGVDMLMAPEDWRQVFAILIDQAQAGTITKTRINDAVTRILRVKARTGLLKSCAPSARQGAGIMPAAHDHRALARQAVRESLVLLKNNNSLLPLRPDSRVLVAGNCAHNIGMQCGGWTLTWQGTFNENNDFPNADSIFDGIRETVTKAGGIAQLSEQGEFVERPDVAIVIFGEPPYAEGQGDTTHLSYSAKHTESLELLLRLKSQQIPIVSVFLSGRPLWVNPELNASNSFIAAWLPGSEGKGISDLLFRDENNQITNDFSGKLSFSWPRNPMQTPLNRGDADYDPLFPYGFGLNYSQKGSSLSELPEQDLAHKLESSRVTVYDRYPVSSFELCIGDKNNWRVAMTGRSASSPLNFVSVRKIDMSKQEDAREFIWHGIGSAWAGFYGSRPLNLSHLAVKDASLNFLICLDAPPTGVVTLHMNNSGPKGGGIDLTRTLQQLPLGIWQLVSIDLQRFIDSGTEMHFVEIPFLLKTDGALRLSLSKVEIAA